MRRWLLVATLTGPLVLAGCDQQAQQSATARRQMEQVRQILADAELGYVPTLRVDIARSGDQLSEYAQQVQAGQQQAEETRLQAWRQEKLQAALELLKPIIAGKDAAEARAARRLAADIHASAARDLQREALKRWAEVSNRSTRLLSQMVAIGRSQSLVASYATDDGPLFARLEDDRRTASEQKDALVRQLQTLAAQIKELEAQIADHRQQSAALLEQEQKLKNEAFPLQGNRRWELYDQAADVALKARQQQSQAEILALDLDVRQSQQTLLQKQLDFKEKFIADVSKSVKNTSARLQDIKVAREKAQAHQETLEKQFLDELALVVSTYNEQVQTLFGDALTQMDQALEELQQATSGAGGMEKRAIEFEQLSQQAQKVELLVSQTLAAYDLGFRLQQIAKRSTGAVGMMTGRHTFFETTARQFASEQAVAIGNAKSLLSEGIALAEELAQSGGEGGDPLSTQATQHKQIFERYSARLDQLNLGGYTGPKAAPPAPAETTTTTTTGNS